MLERYLLQYLSTCNSISNSILKINSLLNNRIVKTNETKERKEHFPGKTMNNKLKWSQSRRIIFLLFSILIDFFLLALDLDLAPLHSWLWGPSIVVWCSCMSPRRHNDPPIRRHEGHQPNSLISSYKFTGSVPYPRFMSIVCFGRRCLSRVWCNRQKLIRPPKSLSAVLWASRKSERCLLCAMLDQA